MKRTVISGSGSYIPEIVKRNEDFLGQPVYAEDGVLIPTASEIIIDKFQKITGIAQRRYAAPHLNTSDIAAEAGALALKSCSIHGEQLDLLIVAHNFGNISASGLQADTVPALASRVKHKLGIKNPACIAFDTFFGCPGWLLAVMQADAFFKAGMAQKALVIGAETLSRVIDPFDRDSMIFSDGAGAAVLEYKEADEGGILKSVALSHCGDEVEYLHMGESYRKEDGSTTKYMKMKGRKVYEYALRHVPQAMKDCLEQSGASIGELKKVFIHQANEKMDEAIVQAFFALYDLKAPAGIMPMCIHWLGNSSVATIPTLFDLVSKGKEAGHQLEKGDLILFASVGAGMNINAVCYRCV
ncbi:MAG: ketoacyl-ACP synthase III [Chitinophagaceae bacterium]|nr:MAG: ketoacyl-ACP synthase III [Chitinophagaceae bacterium]